MPDSFGWPVTPDTAIDWALAVMFRRMAKKRDSEGAVRPRLHCMIVSPMEDFPRSKTEHGTVCIR